jgi:hypothetical protein
VAAAVAAAVTVSEFALGGFKLQTGLHRAAAAWGFTYLLVLVLFLETSGISVTAFTMLWLGLFLSWFGIRSHIESSILMRMINLLGRDGSQTAQALLDSYNAHYGQERRLDELLRGGLVENAGGETRVTRKGRLILRVVSMLR